MAFKLSADNVLTYLQQEGIYSPDETRIDSLPLIQARNYKNFNLVVRVPQGPAFLVKQERPDDQGHFSGAFWVEWRIQQWLDQAARENQSSHALQPLLSRLLHFDAENAILVAEYFEDYGDLSDFYDEVQLFPDAVAHQLGQAIAQIHRATFQNRQAQIFLSCLGNGEQRDYRPRFLYEMDSLGPGIFGMFCRESLEFLRLYQSDRLLKPLVQSLREQWHPCSLVHRDLRLNNILVHQTMQEQLPDDQARDSLENRSQAAVPIRIIDWEKYTWGDPAYDLGIILSDYLRYWLKSLLIHDSVDIKMALSLATVPLEAVQPSLRALLAGYLETFPEIVEQYPNWLEQVLRYVGVALLEKLQVRLEYHLPFGNSDICAMQVARSLLHQPLSAGQSLWGIEVTELLPRVHCNV